MFSAKTYIARRKMLRTKIGQGIILLPGNAPAPNNYPNNAYYFRQDSSFLYYFGLNIPSLVGLIDADSGEEALYGDDFTVEDISWTGPQPTLRELGAQVGVTETFPTAALEARLRKAIAQGRKIHYLPPYRGETKLQLSELLGIKPALLHDYKSVDLMFAVAEMREKKSAEEIEQLLKLVGAKRSVAEIEEARAVKLVKNDVNRRVNAELANQTRSAGAAQHQLALIDELEQRGLRDALPDALAVFCDLRERYPDLSLRDLGEMADPPLSKSALYHRVLRLEKLIEANR